MVVAIIIGGVVLVLTAILVLRASQRRVTNRRVRGLYEAAVAGDRDQLRQWAQSVNLRDSAGDTALHFAYYRHDQDAIDALTAFGADDNLRNKEGLSAVEMGIVATIETQLTAAAEYLRDDGSWHNEALGRHAYNHLLGQKPFFYKAALVRCVIRVDDHRKLLHLAIKLGVSGSEQKLAEVLHGYGTKAMAVDYLNAGSPVLYDAAERWARRNNYHILHAHGQARVSWGQF